VPRAKPGRGTVELNPHSLHLLGEPGSPLYDLVIDCGTAAPAYIIRLPVDLAALLRTKLNSKHIGELL
jgi:hypothetical protein